MSEDISPLEIVAVTIPTVSALIIFALVTEVPPTSDMVTASLPNPVIPVGIPLAVYTAAKSVEVPVSTVIDDAFTNPVVLSSRVTKTEAVNVESVIVTVSVPIPVISVDA